MRSDTVGSRGTEVPSVEVCVSGLSPAPMRPSAPFIVAMSLVTLGGCTGADPRWGPDCVSPFHFRDQEYRLGAQPPDEERVKPGDRLGEGANESCDQYAPGAGTPGDGSDRLTQPRLVYAFPAVPPEQAIIFTNPDGRHASVLLAAEKPEGGWDPDLRRWLSPAPKR